MERLKISPKSKRVGLFIYCNKHKTNVKDNGVCVEKEGVCKHYDRHVYKVRIHVPLTKYNNRTEVLQTRDQAEAAQLATEIYNRVKGDQNRTSGLSVDQFIERYIKFKTNPPKNQKRISKESLADYSLHLNEIKKILKNTDRIGPEKLNEGSAQAIFDSLRHSGRTKQKYFRTYINFFDYLLEIERLSLGSNPFSGWHFNKPTLKNEVILAEEFYQLLAVIDTAPQRAEDGDGKPRLYYFDYLKNAFQFGLFCGARRQEIPLVRWSDIIPNRHTKQLFGGIILLRDIKVTRIQKLDEEKIKPVEINEDMAELLMDMGYALNKGSNRLLFDPEEKYSRDQIKDQLSRSFAHYIKFVNVAGGRELTFKCLRKTWFTALTSQIGVEGASLVGGHSGSEVTQTHYINKIEGMGVAGKAKRIFGNPVQLKVVRNP